jgi:hypothetical protein
MTVVRVRGFQIFKDRHGRLRCYHRKLRVTVDLKKTPIGSPEFFAECARIAALADAKVAKDKPGTLGLLICAYRKSPALQDLAPQTRYDYQKMFDYLRPIADTPLVRFDRPLVVRIRDKAAASKGRRFGNYVKAVLSIIFGWGRERGFLVDNPASGIKDLRRLKGAPEANRPWSDAERDAVLDAAPDHMRPAIALMMFTGLGPKDALTLPRNFVKGGRDRDQASEDRGAGFLAHAAPAGSHSRQSAISRRHNALRQFPGPSLDPGRLPGVMVQGAGQTRKRWAHRAGPDALRAAAHRGRHPSRERLR